MYVCIIALILLLEQTVHGFEQGLDFSMAKSESESLISKAESGKNGLVSRLESKSGLE